MSRSTDAIQVSLCADDPTVPFGRGLTGFARAVALSATLVVLLAFGAGEAQAAAPLLLPCASPSAVAGVVCTPEAFVPNSGAGTVSVLNSSTGALIATVTVGTNPLSAAVTPDGKTAYVVNQTSGTVSAITTATNAVAATITVGTNPVAVAVTPDGKTAYVTNQSDGTVSVFPVGGTSVTRTITVGASPQGVAITPDGKTAYVTNNGAGTVSAITVASNTVTATIAVGGNPARVAVTPDGRTAYVSNTTVSGNTVTAITVATNSIATTIPVGSNPVDLAVTPDGKTVYVANSFNNNVSAITVATNTVAATITVGNTPDGVAVTPDGKTAYVANRGSSSNSVTPITVATNTAGTEIPVGTAPHAVAVAPPPATLYVSNLGPGNVREPVTPVAIATNAVGTGITVGTGPYGSAVTPDGTKLYVTNSNENTVSVINTATGAVTTTFSVCSGSEGATEIAITPNGQTAYAPCYSGNNVAVINLSNNTVTTTIPVGIDPVAVAITPDGSTVYVANPSGSNPSPNSVSVISTTSNTVTATISGLSSPQGLAVSPNGKTLYVSNAGANDVVPIAIPSDTVGTAIPVGTTPNSSPAITPDGSTLYVANFNSGNVSAINTATNTVVRTIAIGGVPYAVAVTPDGKTAYVGQYFNGSNSVTPITVATNTAGTPITGFNRPEGLSVDAPLQIGNAPTLPQASVGHAYSQQLWSVAGTSPFSYSVTSGSLPAGMSLSSSGLLSGTPSQVSTGSFTVAVTDSSTYQQVAVKAFSLEVTGTLSGLGTFPTGMAVDNPSHQVWVAATGSNQITKIDTTANPPAVGAALTDASGSLNYPANLVYDESGSVLSVANLFGSSVTLFGSTSVKVALSGCAHPAGEALVGTHQVYVACGTSSQLYRVDDSTGTTTASGALASGAILSGMADSGTTASGSDAVLAADAQPSGSLYAVDPSTLAVISSRALPAGATAATVAVFNSGSNSVSNTAYVADPGTSQVSIIDVNKGATGAFNGFGTATTVPSVPAGCVPYGVAVGPSNNTLVVSCSGLNEALVYDISNIAGGTPDVPVLLETVAIGSVPDEVAIANGGTVGLAFISNESDNTVSVIDPPNRKSIPAGPLPILSEPVLSPAGPTAPTTTGAAPAPAASPAHAKTKTKTKATKKRRKAKHTTHRRKHVKHHTKHKAKATRGHPASHALVVAQAHLDPLLAPVNGHTVR